MSISVKLNNKIRRSCKRLRRLLSASPAEYERVLLILGCQKSGATTLLNMLDYDLRTETLREDCVLTLGGKERHRLRPIREVSELLLQVKTPLIVAEPKVESHRARELLEHLPRSRILWMSRDYRTWIEANLKRRSGQNEYLKILLENPQDWRAGGASDTTLSLVRKFYTKDLCRTDCAAIIWYCRNVLYFEQGLHRDERALIVSYEQLVRETLATLQRIYAFLGMLPVPSNAGRVVYGRMIRQVDDLRIDPAIEHECIALQARLKQAEK